MKKGFLACLTFAVAASCMAQVDPSRVIATVNGVDIKGAEYYHRMEYLTGVGEILGQNFAEFPPGFLTLDRLITEKLVNQLAKERNVTPTEPEVQAELDYRKSKNPNLVVDWMSRGLSLDELKDDVRMDLTKFKLLTAGITVTDQEVDRFYAENKPMFTSPAQVALRVIVVRSQADADSVDKDLAAGKSFADEAKAKSADVTAVRGGEYGTIAISNLAPNVASSIKLLNAGQTTPWFSAAQGADTTQEPAKFKFLVEQQIAEALVPLSPDLRRQIRQRMMMDSGKAKNHFTQDLDALRAKSTIDIKDKNFADAYKKFMDALSKSAPKGG